jgi:hypothetical protein
LNAGFSQLGILSQDPESPIEISEQHQDLGVYLGLRSDLLAAYAARAERSAGSIRGAYLHARVLEEPAQRRDGIKSALAKDSGFRPARIGLIEALLKCGEIDAAAAELEAIGGIRPGESAEALPALVEFEAGRTEAALARLDALRESGRDTVQIRARRSDLLERLGKADDARRELEETPAARLSWTDLRIDFEWRKIQLDAKKVGVDAALTTWRRQKEDAAFEAGDHEFVAKCAESIDHRNSYWMPWERVYLFGAVARYRRGDLRGAQVMLADISSADESEELARAMRESASLVLGRTRPEDYVRFCTRLGRRFRAEAHYWIGTHHEFGGRRDEALIAHRASLAADELAGSISRLAGAAIRRLDPEAK